MSPYEIVQPGGSVEHWNEESGEVWMRRLQEVYDKVIKKILRLKKIGNSLSLWQLLTNFWRGRCTRLHSKAWKREWLTFPSKVRRQSG